MAAHIPLLAHSNPRRALVVGVGAGQTPERVLLYDPERLDCVDIEPAVFDLVRTHFPNAWMQDPRVHLIDEDGRNFIAHTAARWDVISLEVGQIFRPGAEAFYTQEFYRLVRARLEPGGIVSQFVPLAFLTPEMFGSVLASFIDVFPEAVLWYNSAECLLLGTTADAFAIDVERLDLLQNNKAIHDDLQFSHWNGAATWLNQPHVFLGGFLCGPRAVQALAGTAPLLHDDRPVLGWATRTVDASTANELPLRARIVAQLDPIATIVRGDPLTDSTLAQAAAIRERNLADLAAAAALRRVDELEQTHRYDELEGLLRGALAANPDNLQVNRILGGVLLLRGRVAEAEAAYAHATRQQAGDAESHFGLARALHVQRRFAPAVVEYRAGLTIDANDADAHNNLAAALAEQGQLDDARRHFREALKLRPDFPDAQRNLARLEAATTGR